MAREHVYAERIADDVTALRINQPELKAIEAALRMLASGEAAGYAVPGLLEAVEFYQYPTGRFKLNYTMDDKAVKLVSIFV